MSKLPGFWVICDAAVDDEYRQQPHDAVSFLRRLCCHGTLPFSSTPSRVHEDQGLAFLTKCSSWRAGVYVRLLSTQRSAQSM